MKPRRDLAVTWQVRILPQPLVKLSFLSTPGTAAALLALAAVLAPLVARAQSLPGLTITGNAFTYNAPDGVVSGIIFKPAGAGPFPALLLSHGKGGNANGFSLSHAQNLVRWGFVCIGPNYTHANAGSTPDDEGYSPENSRRARRSLDILAATPGVDLTRLAAFSHSMGSFLTIGLSGELPAQFRAAAIAAGGTSGTTNTAFAQPATQEAQPIRSPFLMFHGTVDTTVPPQQSVNLQTILQGNAVPNRRLLYQGVNHNIVDAPIKRADAYAVMQAWFTQHGVLPVPGNTAPTIVAPASVNAAPGSTSAPLAITIGDAETDAGALTLQAFSLDSDVVAAPPAAGYTGKLPNSGLVIGGSGANRTLTLTPRAGQTGTIEVALVVSEPEGVGQLSAVSFLQVNLSSNPGATLPVSTGDAHLVNLSARANVTIDEPLIAGFVLGGTGTRTLLIRAVGPTLAAFGVADALPNPRLQLFENQTTLATNDDWRTGNVAQIAAAATAAGAFALPAASTDAVLLIALPAGQYSAHAQTTTAASGNALIEIYDLGGDAGARLANLSVRSRTGPGSGALIAGFVVAGTGARALLLRGIGPALTGFGVAGALADPQLQLFANGTALLVNDDWGQSGAATILPAFSAQSGAFPLPAGSKDSAISTALASGAYSALVTPATGAAASGTALVEIYAP